MRVKFSMLYGGYYEAALGFADGDCVREFIVAWIELGSGGRWYVRFSDGSKAIPGCAFDVDPFERKTLAKAKTELEARLFVALVGQRSGLFVREIRGKKS